MIDFIKLKSRLAEVNWPDFFDARDDGSTAKDKLIEFPKVNINYCAETKVISINSKK